MSDFTDSEREFHKNHSIDDSYRTDCRMCKSNLEDGIYKVIGPVVDDLKRYRPIGWSSPWGTMYEGVFYKPLNWHQRLRKNFWVKLHDLTVRKGGGGCCE